jgi:ABC-2 type transport system ATP-binding protein
VAKLPKDVAIRVRDVHKDFRLPHHHDDSIKHKIITVFRKKDKGADLNHALRGVSFDVKKGEFFGVVGRNGSGKSTLLKIISKIYQPTSGTADYDGKLVAFIELGVGFNPQLTGRENVYLNAAMLGFSRRETDAMYDEIVAFAELADFMELDLKNYSSGMKVRLAFSVAIRAQADILVLDEVLAVGDAAFKKKCNDYFKNLKEAHKTIILVTHSMEQVKEYCDRAMLIEDGKIAFEGSAEDAADAYTRLFNPSKDGKSSGTNDRWGSGEVQFDAIHTEIDKEELTITMDLKGNQDVNNFIVAMNIYSAEKRILTTGIAKKVRDANRLSIKKGEKKRLQCTFQNLLGCDSYTIIAALWPSDESQAYDYWRDAAQFTNPNGADIYPSLYPLNIKY